MVAEFFKGPVNFLKTESGFFSAPRVQYTIEGNSQNIISVLADTHIRLLEKTGFENQPSPENLPKQFHIIAPMEAVKVIKGNIPQNHLHWLDHTEYLRYRMMYIGV